jgi:hypothetical protein
MWIHKWTQIQMSQPNAMIDDLGREAMTMIKRIGGAHQCSKPDAQSDLIYRQ